MEEVCGQQLGRLGYSCSVGFFYSFTRTVVLQLCLVYKKYRGKKQRLDENNFIKTNF